MPDKLNNETNTLTVIPAKLGSVRFKKKNIRKLAGIPLINYTIKAALESLVCGEVMVSTESIEISEIANKVIIINQGKIVAEGKSYTLVDKHFQDAVIKITTNAKLADLKAELKKIKQIKSAKKVAQKAGFVSIEVTCSDPDQVSLDLFDLMVKNKWKLKELTTTKQNIEELFKVLTK